MTNKYALSYAELLDLTNEISPQQRCLNSLMSMQCLNEFSVDFMNDVLAGWKHRHNTRYYNLLVTDGPKIDSRYGRNSIPYRVNQI